MSARLLEPLVWGQITKILLEPQRLLRGYKESLAEQEKESARQRDHLRTLNEQLTRLEEKRRNLTFAYIDPEIKMTKVEYVGHKSHIDTDIDALRRRIRKLEEQLGNTPKPADLKTLESFASEVRAALAAEDKLTPQKKRRLLQALHVEVIVEPDRTIAIQGWFGEEVHGVSYTTC